MCKGLKAGLHWHLHELRKNQPKLKDGKSVKGSKHRLTDKNLDKLETYYGNAIRANVKPGTLTPQEQKEQIEVMKKAILAVLYHTCEIGNNINTVHQGTIAGARIGEILSRRGTIKRKDRNLDVFFPRCPST